MKTIDITPYIIFVAGTIFSSSPALADESEPSQKKMVAIDSTINALDYVLQKPDPNETFESKKFGDHLFLSIGGGADWTRSDNSTFSLSSRPEFRLGISAGDWLSPVHGWRLSLEFGKHRGVNRSTPKFIGLSADYLMNFSSLLRNYNPDRRFELIGLAGIELEGVFKNRHNKKMAYGFHIGLQPRLYLSPMTYLYMEPRIGFYSDGIDMASTWNRYDWNASVMVGIGFRMNPLKGFKVDNSLFVNESFADNLFFGVNAGVNTILNSPSGTGYAYGATVGAVIGKWFTAASALRLGAHAGTVNQPRSRNRWLGLGDIDYLLNVNSLLTGYDPERKFDGNIVLGVSGAMTSGNGRKFAAGFHGGLQFLWNINPTVSLYAEPSVRVMSSKLSALPTPHPAVMPSVNIGLIYRMRKLRFRNGDNESILHSEPFSHRFFMDLTGGVFVRHRNWFANHAFAMSLGEWFTSSSAWRISGEYNWMKSQSDYLSLSASADYMLSLGSIADGYDPDRSFDVAPFVGFGVGMAHYNISTNNITWGPRAGLRASFRLSSLFDIVLEPSVRITALRHSSRRYNPEAHIMAGISYKFGRYSRDSTPDDSRLFNTDLPANFVSIEGGPSMFSESLLGKSVLPLSWKIGASFGHWFSKSSGLQLAFDYDLVDRDTKSRLDIGSVRLDYLLNLTAAMTGQTESKFNFIGLIGAGIGWSNHNNGYISPTAHLGIRADYRLTDNLHLTLTPEISVWQPALNSGCINNHHFIGTGALPVGITYNF